jgi:hypothetical protein
VPDNGEPRSLTVELFSPGMTPLHRVGVAGLAMTLRALDSDRTAASDLLARGSWQVSDRAVTLAWDGDR